MIGNTILQCAFSGAGTCIKIVLSDTQFSPTPSLDLLRKTSIPLLGHDIVLSGILKQTTVLSRTRENQMIHFPASCKATGQPWNAWKSILAGNLVQLYLMISYNAYYIGVPQLQGAIRSSLQDSTVQAPICRHKYLSPGGVDSSDERDTSTVGSRPFTTYTSCQQVQHPINKCLPKD